jgi:glycolate oxidase iron-sulfur subunit
MRNVVKGHAAVRTLLDRIPGLHIDALDSGCCGAAGSYFLTQPAMADTLAQIKVAQAQAARPDYVVSSNAGCAMHLGAALRRAGVTVPVWHPLRLLAQQLAD